MLYVSARDTVRFAGPIRRMRAGSQAAGMSYNNPSLRPAAGAAAACHAAASPPRTPSAPAHGRWALQQTPAQLPAQQTHYKVRFCRCFLMREGVLTELHGKMRPHRPSTCCHMLMRLRDSRVCQLTAKSRVTYKTLPCSCAATAAARPASSRPWAAAAAA